MNCPYCGEELIQEDSFGILEYIRGNDKNGKRGDIYFCPNREGFTDKESADEYLKSIDETYESIGITDFDELKCENSKGNGFYYCYVNSDEIREGYPC